MAAATPIWQRTRNIARLIRDLTACGLEDKVHFTGYLPYGEFVERLRRSRFLLPLVDDRISAGDYQTRTPAAIPLSLGLGVPMIVNEAIARRFDLDFMVCYPGENLASGVAAARSMSEAEYARLRERTRAPRGARRRTTTKPSPASFAGFCHEVGSVRCLTGLDA